MNVAVKKSDSENANPQEIKKQKTICVMQITRIGDLIQTCQTCQDLKGKHEDIRLILVAREQFVKPLEFLTKGIFDKIYTINTESFICEQADEDLDSPKQKLKAFLGELNDENISVLVNLSFSKSSGFLSSLINAQFKLGLVYNESGSPSITDKWSQYIYTNVMGGSLCGIQLVDIYKLILGLKPNYIETKEVKGTVEKEIIIHPFASQKKKRWKASKWAEIIYKVLKENPEYNISIVGAKNELDQAQEILQSPSLRDVNHRIVSLVGKTSLETLYEKLKTVALFIGHDSMVGHLGAYSNTPTLTISLGTVRPHETTPYHSFAYNIAPKTKCFPCFPDEKCDDLKCHTDIPFQLIGTCVNQILNGGALDNEFIANSVSPFHCSSVDIYRAKKSNKDLFALEDINIADANIKEIFRSLYRYSWLYFLSEIEESIPFPNLNKTTYEALLIYTKGLQNLFELCEFGQKYSKYILEEISSQTTDIARIKSFSKKIDEIDQLQDLTKNTFPFLAPIVDYFKLVKSNLTGSNIVELTESSYLCYQDNANFCCVLYELIEQTLSNYTKNTRINHSTQEVRK